MRVERKQSDHLSTELAKPKSMQSRSKKRRSCRGDEAVESGSLFLPPPDVGGYVLLHRYGLVGGPINTMTYYLPSRSALSRWARSTRRCPASAHIRSCFQNSNGMNWSLRHASIRHRIIPSFAPRSSFWRRTGSPTTRSGRVFRCRGRLSANGASAFLTTERWGYTTNLAPGVRPVFLPEVVVQIKAMACELPATSGPTAFAVQSPGFGAGGD